MSLDLLSNRLKLAMYEAGVTQSWLAERVGITQGAIQKLVAGKATSSRHLVDIARALGVSPDWLNTGVGPMHTSHPAVNDSKKHTSNVAVWDNDTQVSDDEVEVPFLKDIEFACGDGSIADEDYNGFKMRFQKSILRRAGANSDGSGVLCFPVHGNSMDPMIPDGATVAVNCNDKKIVDGKIYAINQDGWKRLKSLHRTAPDEVTVRSFNTAEYPDETIKINQIEIVGRMFWMSMVY